MHHIPSGRVRRASAAIGIAAAAGLTLAAITHPVAALDTASSGNGGSANATNDGAIDLDNINSGFNGGNVISMGDVAGSAEVNGGVMTVPTLIDVIMNNSTSMANASGGDSAGIPSGPENIDIKVDSHSKASGGKGGQGGEGGVGYGGEGGAGGTGNGGAGGGNNTTTVNTGDGTGTTTVTGDAGSGTSTVGGNGGDGGVGDGGDGGAGTN